MITKRDTEVLEFIKNNPCKSDIIEKLFYPSYRVAMKRLNTMYEEGYVKRYRPTPNDKYFYYIGTKPKQVEHMDLTARSILWIKSKGYNVVSFKREVKLEGIRPDAIAGIEKGGNCGILMIEIERFNNSLKKKLELYEKIYKDKKYFSEFKILYVCNNRVTGKVLPIICIRPTDLDAI